MASKPHAPHNPIALTKLTASVKLIQASTCPTPRFHPKPPANSPPYRLSHASRVVRQAIEATEAARQGG